MSEVSSDSRIVINELLVKLCQKQTCGVYKDRFNTSHME